MEKEGNFAIFLIGSLVGARKSTFFPCFLPHDEFPGLLLLMRSCLPPYNLQLFPFPHLASPPTHLKKVVPRIEARPHVISPKKRKCERVIEICEDHFLKPASFFFVTRLPNNGCGAKKEINLFENKDGKGIRRSHHTKLIMTWLLPLSCLISKPQNPKTEKQWKKRGVGKKEAFEKFGFCPSLVKYRFLEHCSYYCFLLLLSITHICAGRNRNLLKRKSRKKGKERGAKNGTGKTEKWKQK